MIVADAFEIRPLRTYKEYLACVALQDETWGANFSERVPAAILKVSQRIGGVTAGAFDGDDRLMGFVFGMTGVENGRLVHWSDMLAVRPEARDSGLGNRLKQYQRDVVRAIGVSVIYWTFDPLVAKNAYLNFTKLGVRAVEYVRDMYGAETDSALHRGVGTDRLIAAWDIGALEQRTSSERDPRRLLHVVESAPVINREGSRIADFGFLHSGAESPNFARIQIPLDIQRVQTESLESATAWRESSRSAFLAAFAAGYEIAGFYPDRHADAGYYVMTRKVTSSAGTAPNPPTATTRR
ncbi:MAG: hypothetical protein H0W30_00550 [Gemmatimonadaceae bacterium]|nr:hypothetical protein [Gemmatimonadaceae bacterium]